MLISLIIPTRERSTYLAECIRTATAIDDPGIEIVVSDNASTDGTAEVMAAQRDPRIVSLRTERRVSMRQNFEFALERSRGDYVIFIGDDDGFLPRQFPALRMILERERPDLFGWSRLTYGWPVPGFGRRVGGVRFHRTRVFGPPRRVDLQRARERMLRADLEGMGPTPTIYHGCASRACLDRMRGRGGQVFGARCPDVYVTYRSVLTHSHFLYSRHPFSVSGHSPASTGNAHHAYRSDDPRSEPARRFGAEGSVDPVQDAIPEHVPSLGLNRLSTLETVIADLGTDVRCDHQAWFRHILAEVNPADAALRAELLSILRAHSSRSRIDADVQAAASRAVPGAYRVRRSPLAVGGRLWSSLNSFKCSASRGGQNTVRTASALADAVLGSTIEQVVHSGRRPRGAWRSALIRAVGHAITNRRAEGSRREPRRAAASR